MTAIYPQTIRVDLSRWPDLRPLRRSIRGKVEVGLAGVLFRAAVGRLEVRVNLPDGSTIGAGGPESPVMELHRPQTFYRRIGADGLIGFGESYMAGDWDAEDLGGFLTVLCREIANLVPAPLQRLRAAYVARHPASERNTETQTRANIARHYDLSNEMFQTFLDSTMTYSAALFSPATAPVAAAPGRPTAADLPRAQNQKIDRLLDQAGVGPGTRLLEIGTGWGHLALRAAARGARVHSVTLSSEQLALAQERVDRAGLGELVSLELRDYRLVEGEYDAVVSVEMIEAVGFDYLPEYFEKIDSLLAPGGRVALQAITMPHHRMLATRDTYTWIHKYIFPGGFLPSIELIDQVADARTGLRMVENFGMGPHYAETLRLWDEAFAGAHERVAALGFDPVFERMWHFYLEYSRAGFAASYLDVNQLTFVKGQLP